MLTLRLNFMKNVKSGIKKINNVSLNKHLILSGAFFVPSVACFYLFVILYI
jgi:hypothetical protein